MPEAVILEPVRTAIGKYNGSLAGIPAVDLGAAVIRETIARAGLDVADLASVTMGNVVQASNKMNPARQAAIHAGLPVSVPAVTVNRVRLGCGSDRQWLSWPGCAAKSAAGGTCRASVYPGREDRQGLSTLWIDFLGNVHHRTIFIYLARAEQLGAGETLGFRV